MSCVSDNIEPLCKAKSVSDVVRGVLSSSGSNSECVILFESAVPYINISAESINRSDPDLPRTSRQWILINRIREPLNYTEYPRGH